MTSISKLRGFAISVAAVFLLFSYFVYADSHIARFVFITEPETILPGGTSEEIKIQAQDVGGNPTSAGVTLCLGLSSTSGSGEFSSNPDNWSPVNVLTINSNWTSRSFYYKDSGIGTHRIDASIAVRPDGTTCPLWPVAEWDVKWVVNQTITVSGGNQSQPPVSGNSSGGEDTTQQSSASSGGIASPFQPSIKAYAGEDRTVVVGSLVYFNGRALGVKNEPLEEGVRFWWNFGDGAAVEGRVVTHIFAATGTYIVGLHVSSGLSSASDYLTVAVVPNQVAVASVVGGAEGFVRLKNSSEYVIDIGGWHLSDAVGATFMLPPHTKINVRSEIAFPNSVTGLLQSGSADVVLYYPNGVKASESVSKSAVANNVSVTTVERNVLLQSPLPVRETIVVQKAAHEEGTSTETSAEHKTASRNGAIKELAQISASYTPSRSLFFWLAFGLSVLAAAGFLLAKNKIGHQ